MGVVEPSIVRNRKADAACSVSDAAGPDLSGPAVMDRGRPSRVSNGSPLGITGRPREDYRTALLSDSPDAGCSLSHRSCGGIGKRPGRRSAVPREHRAAGRFSSEDWGRSLSGMSRRRNTNEGPDGPKGHRSRGNNPTRRHRSSKSSPPGVPAQAGMNKQQQKHILSGLGLAQSVTAAH